MISRDMARCRAIWRDLGSGVSPGKKFACVPLLSSFLPFLPVAVLGKSIGGGLAPHHLGGNRG